jgi:NAD(P)-dependent dehydrogenase (short-subunit alcohol dehydrogenase family)
MKFDFSNHVIVITGAAGNLGGACIEAFRTAGARLILLDRSPDRLARLHPDLAGSPNALFSQPVDVTDPASVQSGLAEGLNRFGRIDGLINIAGGYRAGTPTHETPISDWDYMLNLNARSVFVVCQAVIPGMIKQKSGRIVNISSRAALGGGAGQAAYSVSKTAVLRLTESMAAELKESGINVNCVLPGIIDTPQNRAAMPGADFSHWVAPEAIADVILFLASDAARAVTGAAIPVFGCE